MQRTIDSTKKKLARERWDRHNSRVQSRETHPALRPSKNAPFSPKQAGAMDVSLSDARLRT